MPAGSMSLCGRGGGWLSLRSLVHMAEQHAGVFQVLMQKSAGTRSDLEYPFAAAGVNITFRLAGACWGDQPAGGACMRGASAQNACEGRQSRMHARGQNASTAHPLTSSVHAFAEMMDLNKPQPSSRIGQQLARLVPEDDDNSEASECGWGSWPRPECSFRGHSWWL